MFNLCRHVGSKVEWDALPELNQAPISIHNNFVI